MKRERIALLSRIATYVRHRAQEGQTQVHVSEIQRVFKLGYDRAIRLMRDTPVFFDDIEYSSGYLYVKRKHKEARGD